MTSTMFFRDDGSDLALSLVNAKQSAVACSLEKAVMMCFRLCCDCNRDKEAEEDRTIPTGRGVLSSTRMERSISTYQVAAARSAEDDATAELIVDNDDNSRQDCCRNDCIREEGELQRGINQFVRSLRDKFRTYDSLDSPGAHEAMTSKPLKRLSVRPASSFDSSTKGVLTINIDEVVLPGSDIQKEMSKLMAASMDSHDDECVICMENFDPTNPRIPTFYSSTLETIMDNSGIVVAVLHLPAGSILCFDGQQVALKSDDFVGFGSVPDDNSFHFLTTRAAHRAGHGNAAIGVTVGFVIFANVGNHFIRCYDPLTEETSTQPVDPLTRTNLLDQIGRGRIGAHRLVHYQLFTTAPCRIEWNNLSCFISESFLRSKHNLHSGDKIIPSSFVDDEEDVQLQQVKQARLIADGVAVTYPCIPVIRAIQTARHSQHKGTKQLLARLESPQRSALFIHPHSGDLALQIVIDMHYDSNWRLLLADLQLSYLLFVHLHCFASLQCWRDLIAMLSLAEMFHERIEMYRCFLDIMLQQFSSVDRDFFDDMDMPQDNNVLSCIQRLLSKALATHDPQLSALAVKLKRVTANLLQAEDAREEDGDDDSDEDAPIVVSTEEVESSLLRIASLTSSAQAPSGRQQPLAENIQEEYSLLVAAMTPTEDIVMTCSRVLDAANDVSLVREAAHYLEHVEAKKRH
ncbi:hypothetical protein MPSEU_000472300 [Mayamaea pseudoterrestris]|nr:hypothetical protein MPSEU_000472300 [Mayamaea pseudoterrestris]